MIHVIQKLSSELIEGSQDYLPGAFEGDFALGGGKFASKIVYRVDSSYETYMEWAPRDSGQGLVKVHGRTFPDSLEHFPRSVSDVLMGKWHLISGNVLQKYQVYDGPAGQMCLTKTTADDLGELEVGKTYRLSTVLLTSGSGKYSWYSIRAEEV